MFQVIQARQGGDLCAACGKAIRPGTVFVIKPIPLKGHEGQYAYVYMHLWCDARRRGAQKEKHVELSRRN